MNNLLMREGFPGQPSLRRVLILRGLQPCSSVSLYVRSLLYMLIPRPSVHCLLPSPLRFLQLVCRVVVYITILICQPNTASVRRRTVYNRQRDAEHVWV